MVTKLDPAIHELASGPNYGVLATLMPNGWPQTSLVWVDSDGGYLLVNTEVHRQKFLNVSRDDRGRPGCERRRRPRGPSHARELPPVGPTASFGVP